MTAVLSALAPTWTRSAAAGAALLVDAFPSTAVNLLPEWEATLGLPDPCAGPAPTLAARQAQVTARFAGVGGASVPYLIAYAATLGYTITITEYTPATVRTPVNGPMYGIAWASAFTVNAAAGSNAVLECEINEVKQAHLVAAFHYT